jgi:hypothetical protein
MASKKNSLALRPSSEVAPASSLPVKTWEKPPEVEAWFSLMLQVRKALLGKNTPARQRELLEIRAKLVIMGPDFLKRADVTKLRAMFDKTFL